jgi:hypothetical protein
VAEDGRLPVALPPLGHAESRRIQLRERSAEPIGIGGGRVGRGVGRALLGFTGHGASSGRRFGVSTASELP